MNEQPTNRSRKGGSPPPPVLLDVSDHARDLGIAHPVAVSARVWRDYVDDELETNRRFHLHYILRRMKVSATDRLSWPRTPSLSFTVPFFDTDDEQPLLSCELAPAPDGGMLVVVTVKGEI